MSRYRFGPFSLDSETRVLLRDGEPIPIGGKTFDTLLVLVESRGRLPDKDELLSRVWPAVVVEEANLNQSISTVRKLLSDNPKDHRYIVTVAGRGYQFLLRRFGIPSPDNRHLAIMSWVHNSNVWTIENF